MPNTVESPRPVPLPISLVVKNGSKIFSISSGGMPWPVSRTSISTWSPAGVPPRPSAEAGPGSVTFSVRIISLPPSGIASRALTARFTITCSNWLTSAFTGQTSRPCFSSRATRSPSSRLSRSVSSDNAFPDVHHLRAQGLPARERQELADEARRPVGVLLDLHDVLEGRIGRPVAREQQIRVADDRLQDVVEVVRDAARELADGVHLLGLGDLLLQLTLGRGVEGVQDHPLGLVGLLSRIAAVGRAEPDPRRAAPGPVQLDLDRLRIGETARRAGEPRLQPGPVGHRIGDVGLDPGDALPVDRPVLGLPRHRAEQPGEGGVGPGDPPAPVERRDGDRRVVEEPGEPHLGGALRLVGLGPGRAVDHEGPRGAGLAVLAEGDSVVEPHRQGVAVAAAEVEVEPVGAHLARQAGGAHEDIRLRGDLGEMRAAGADAGEVVAEPGRERGVHVDDGAGRIDRQEARRGVVEVVDRVLEFLEDVLLALALGGDVGHGPERGRPARTRQRPDRDPVPPEGTLAGRGPERRRHPDLLGMGPGIARGLRQAVDRLGDLRGADQDALHRHEVGEGVAAGDPQIGLVGVDQPAAVLDDQLPVGRGVDDALGDVVPGGAAAELERPDGQREQEEHARHGQQRQQPHDERLGLLVGHEGQADGGPDQQSGEHEQQPDPARLLRPVDRARRLRGGRVRHRDRPAGRRQARILRARGGRRRSSDVGHRLHSRTVTRLRPPAITGHGQGGTTRVASSLATASRKKVDEAWLFGSVAFRGTQCGTLLGSHIFDRWTRGLGGHTDRPSGFTTGARSRQAASWPHERRRPRDRRCGARDTRPPAEAGRDPSVRAMAA